MVEPHSNQPSTCFTVIALTTRVLHRMEHFRRAMCVGLVQSGSPWRAVLEFAASVLNRCASHRQRTNTWAWAKFHLVLGPLFCKIEVRSWVGEHTLDLACFCP